MALNKKIKALTRPMNKNNSHNLAKILTFKKKSEIKGWKIKEEREGDGTWKEGWSWPRDLSGISLPVVETDVSQPSFLL